MTDASKTAPAGCIFCTAFDVPEQESLIVHRGVRAFVILNKFPYNNGHLMIVPMRHVALLGDLDAEDLAEVMALAQMAERALAQVYQPHGFNLGINLGRPAGAGILDHLHLHMVPRWNGDTSFISVLGNTRVLPEGLSDTATRLRPIFERIRGGA